MQIKEEEADEMGEISLHHPEEKTIKSSLMLSGVMTASPEPPNLKC